MSNLVRWNFSGKGRRMMQASAFVISYPKSGRTWVRVFYFSYLSALANRPFSLDSANYPEYPHAVFVHDLWEHQRIAGWWDFLRGKYLVPPRARTNKKIVLLVRDPRDVLVSLHFHLSNRTHHVKWQPQSLKAMLHDPRFGISHIVNLMNHWYEEWNGKPNFLLVRYEDCRARPEHGMKRLLEFVGFEKIDQPAFEKALQFSSFENMRTMEAKGEFKESILQSGTPENQNSFKTRRGKVGGFKDYFDADDIHYAAAEMSRLHPDFHYPAEPGEIKPAQP